MSERGVVEAALFSAGKPLTVEEIAATTGLGAEGVQAALAELVKAYDERGSAVQITRIGSKWTMQIRPEYGEKARAFVPPELPKDLLKTAALIAYHEPLRQSDLVRMVGSKAYDHVRTLQDHSLITTRPLGQTLELKTSAAFPEFFGLPVRDREEMRKLLMERVAPASSPSIAGPERGEHV